MKLYAYKSGSESAKALSAALGIKRLLHEGKRIVVNEPVINWGASQIADRVVVPNEGHIINHPSAVAKACNKLSTFVALKEAGVSTPDWTESIQEASKWIDEGATVVCRTKLTGHSGQGIVLADKQDDLVKAPLYTKYVNKKHEYRIHVFAGEAFFLQRKARKMEVPDEKVNWKIRNLDGGFIFANKDVQVGDEAKEQAIMSVKALGLDFGACDIIWEERKNKYYVLEVNTACGLMGTTLEKYVEQFQNL